MLESEKRIVLAESHLVYASSIMSQVKDLMY